MTRPSQRSAELAADGRPQQSLGHWAARLSWAARGAMERRLKSVGVTPPMMAALLAMDGGCLRAADLARHMGVDAAAVTRLLDRLGRAGLVGRSELKGDRRCRSLSLSPKAQALLPRLRAIARDLEAKLAQGMGGVERERLIQALKALTERAEGL